MDYSNGRKVRGLMKGKLIGPFYRSAPKNAAQQYFNSTKVVIMKPNTAAAATAAHKTSSSVSALTAHKVSFVNMPPPEPQTQTAAAAGNKLMVTSDHLHHHHNHNQVGGADHHLHEVDAKAATYISAVQQRFKMDHDEERTLLIQL